ncbi:MAG TPA: hypothetical protein VND21_07910, partial [Planctomycetota bacterium]|nr:hypothetical protein [Planctomycetota bacterium]
MTGLRFAAEAGWIAAVAAGALVLLAWLESRGDGSRARRATRFGVRGLLLVAVALALAAPSWRASRPAPRRLVLAVDRASVREERGRAVVEELLRRARASAARDGVALTAIAFGAAPAPFDPSAPVPPPPDDAPPSRLAPALAAARLAAGADA